MSNQSSKKLVSARTDSSVRKKTAIAPCTRCGSFIHSRVKLDPEFVPSIGGGAHHVICVGCSLEWVE